MLLYEYGNHLIVEAIILISIRMNQYIIYYIFKYLLTNKIL